MQDGRDEHVLCKVGLLLAEIDRLALALWSQRDFFHEVSTEYVDCIEADPDFKPILFDADIGCGQDQLAYGFDSTYFYNSLDVEYDEKVQVFEREADDFAPSDLQGRAVGFDGYFADCQFVGGDVGESMVVGDVEERWLFEAFEDGLADYLHQLIYSRL